MAKVVKHTLDGHTTNHLPGSALCDYQTLCGSVQDDGVFEPSTGRVDCRACLDQVRTALRSLTSAEVAAITREGSK